MADLQAEKKLVLNYFSEIDSCDIESLTEVISKYVSEDFNMKCTCLLYTSDAADE